MMTKVQTTCCHPCSRTSSSIRWRGSSSSRTASASRRSSRRSRACRTSRRRSTPAPAQARIPGVRHGRLIDVDRRLQPADVGEGDGYPGDIWHAICASGAGGGLCRAAGIGPVDGPFADFENPEVYREVQRRSMILRAPSAGGRFIRRKSSTRSKSITPRPRIRSAPASSRRATPKPRPRAWARSTSTASWSGVFRSASCATPSANEG